MLVYSLQIAELYFPQAEPPRDRRRSSSTVSITARVGTSLATSTFPISRGRTKCTTPFWVFLSDCSRLRILRGFTFTSGRRPRLNTASAIRPAVTLSVRPTLRAMLVAAIMPQATASPCNRRRYPVSDSSAWPMVWPKLSTRRRPSSRSSAETTSAFSLTDCGITLQNARAILLEAQKEFDVPDDAALQRLIESGAKLPVGQRLQHGGIDQHHAGMVKRSQ